MYCRYDLDYNEALILVNIIIKLFHFVINIDKEFKDILIFKGSAGCYWQN